MKILSEISRFAPNAMLLSLVTGAVAGLLYTALLPMLLISVDNFSAVVEGRSEQALWFGLQISHPKLAGVFLLACLTIMLAQSCSMLLLQRISVSFATTMRQNLYQRIRKSPISNVEQTGPSKLITTLTTDVNIVVAGASTLPVIAVSLVMIGGVLTYLCVINRPVFFIIGGFLLVAGLSYQILLVVAARYYTHARHFTGHLQESFRGLVTGAKELKLNKARRDSFFQYELLRNDDGVRTNIFRGELIRIFAENYGMILSYFIMAFMVFIFVNYYPVTHSELLTVVMVLLYMSGPVKWALDAFPVIARANISLQKINDVFAQLTEEEYAENYQTPAPWQQIHYKGVRYKYGSNGFSVGPVDLIIRRGEITFIVGGNGSGKSTFCKVATLHYLPTSGDILFDDQLLTAQNINSYRQSICAVFSDYFLFNQLHGVDWQHPERLQEIDYLLDVLALKDKVKVHDGRFSTLQLSDGQRRRLALMVALLEDRDLYLFDEWAADQDPEFRELFYLSILPSLKKRNKAVIVITHDDRYFHCADHLVRFDAGKVSIPKHRADFAQTRSAPTVEKELI
ncbi:cyclic peptide export ABC transporter [Alkalimonas amylolytica]|uniref:Putative ATP-binding cassette transporter n=1 Tax=Alkalimonas amylolytica TaxID=152573 RepID=A0A1H4G3C9_ALKAM|nr:cyclic peptide export ABC transporter [Alkalimonas amylolytica]SEB03917.1 putative ATP-binding cassette transporter [Alkalimonas amylolytica]